MLLSPRRVAGTFVLLAGLLCAVAGVGTASTSVVKPAASIIKPGPLPTLTPNPCINTPLSPNCYPWMRDIFFPFP